MLKYMKATFYHSCVGWPSDDVRAEGGLTDMISEAKDITRRTFLKNVDRDSRIKVEKSFGVYAPYESDSPLTFASDWHISYHKSKLHGQVVYYFKHSSIEYVFKI